MKIFDCLCYSHIPQVKRDKLDKRIERVQHSCVWTSEFWRKLLWRKMEKNQTWVFVPRSHDKNIIGVKWVFRTKLNPYGSLNKHKARIVVKVILKIFGVDYAYTIAPIAKAYNKVMTCYCCTKRVASVSNWCQVSISQWLVVGGNSRWATRRVYHQRTGR